MSLSVELIQWALKELKIQAQNPCCRKTDGLSDAINQLENGQPDIAFIAEILQHSLQEPLQKSLTPEEIPEMRAHFHALDKLTTAFRKEYVNANLHHKL